MPCESKIDGLWDFLPQSSHPEYIDNLASFIFAMVAKNSFLSAFTPITRMFLNSLNQGAFAVASPSWIKTGLYPSSKTSLDKSFDWLIGLFGYLNLVLF